MSRTNHVVPQYEIKINKERIEFTKVLLKRHVINSCQTCDDWEAPRCIRFNVAPPLDVQITGCEQWNQIPF